jgi:hypothetical protein
VDTTSNKKRREISKFTEHQEKKKKQQLEVPQLPLLLSSFFFCRVAGFSWRRHQHTKHPPQEKKSHHSKKGPSEHVSKSKTDLKKGRDMTERGSGG